MGLIDRLQILTGDCLAILPTLEPQSVQCCVTSPPYWGLRDYGCKGQLGLESTPEEYLSKMVTVFRDVWRVLRDDGTLWVNMGDCYSSGNSGDLIRDSNGGFQPGLMTRTQPATKANPGRRPVPEMKPKDLCMMPARLALALQADGWYLRSDIIWHKPNPMPESVTDRPTKAHEYIFLLAKQERYFYDAEAIREPISENTIWNGPSPDKGARSGFTTNGTIGSTLRIESKNGRNKRDVWSIVTQHYNGTHFATFPEDLIKPCILAGSRLGDAVLDPFAGSGTTGKVAIELGRKAVLIELNPAYIQLVEQRTFTTPGFF